MGDADDAADVGDVRHALRADGRRMPCWAPTRLDWRPTLAPHCPMGHWVRVGRRRRPADRRRAGRPGRGGRGVASVGRQRQPPGGSTCRQRTAVRRRWAAGRDTARRRCMVGRRTGAGRRRSCRLQRAARVRRPFGVSIWFCEE